MVGRLVSWSVAPAGHGQWAAMALQRRWQKLGTRSMHWYTAGCTARGDLTQSRHAGWHPPGAASMHRHCGVSDLVHPPQLSQHGHALPLAFAAAAAADCSSSPPCPLLWTRE